KNARLRRRLQRLMQNDSLRVLGWTEHMVKLMRSADLLVSKLGNTFDEAIAAELPLIALEPPPGSERVQYKLLDEWGVGHAVRTVDRMVETVSHLMEHKEKLDAMRSKARARKGKDSAALIAGWLSEQNQNLVSSFKFQVSSS